MQIDIEVHDGVLCAEVSGKFLLSEAKRTFLEILELVAERHIDKVLLDGRLLTGEPEMMERFYYGAFAARNFRDSIQRGTPAWTRFAYILIVPVWDRNRFGETVARNRGMCVSTFGNREDAFVWLAETVC